MTNYADLYQETHNRTPQSKPLPGRTDDQVKNTAGGYVWKTDDENQMLRFLTIGSEGGTYYIGEAELTRQNAKAVIRCIQADGIKAVNLIREISVSGRAHKQSPVMFALALAMLPDIANLETRSRAFAVFNDIIRTGSHLQYITYQLDQTQGKSLRGWGRGLRTAVANWYTTRNADQLAFQMMKYQKRYDRTHVDMMRLAHPKFASEDQNRIAAYVTGKYEGDFTDLPEIIQGWEKIKAAKTSSAAERLVRDYNLPWELIPTKFHGEIGIWEILAEKMPATALIRNLGRMTANGTLVKFGRTAKTVAERLGNRDWLLKSRIHPMTILQAYKVYEQGQGERGRLSWSPVRMILDALDAAFYLVLPNVKASGANILNCVDISGSMTSYDAHGMTGMTCAQVAGAMSLIMANTEPNVEWVGYDRRIYELNFTKKMTLAQAYREANRNGGGTDATIPVKFAIDKRINGIDAFVYWTDNETWAGDRHLTEAIGEYRKKFNPGVKLVVAAMVSNTYSMADPLDAHSLNVSGFDAGAAQTINDFLS